jgi:hypothetical protein
MMARKPRCLISMRVVDCPDAGEPGRIKKCKECGMAIWVGRSSPRADQYICLPCWADLASPDDEILPPTPEQVKIVMARG